MFNPLIDSHISSQPFVWTECTCAHKEYGTTGIISKEYLSPIILGV